jgi:hypothetical protein
MKNDIFWDTKTEFAPHKKHVSTAEPSRLMRFEVSKAVSMNNAIFCDVTPCGSCKNVFQRNVLPPSSWWELIFLPCLIFHQMMEAIYSSETSVLTRPTLRYIPEDGIDHKTCWKEANVLQIEPWSTCKTFKEPPRIVPVDHPIS